MFKNKAKAAFINVFHYLNLGRKKINFLLLSNAAMKF